MRVFLAGVVGLAAVMARALTADAVDSTAAVPTPSVGQLMLEVVDVDSGEPLPARVRLTPTALLEPTRVLVDRNGKVRTTLSEGRYSVSVTHGPEWSHFEREVVVEGGTIRLRAALSRLVDASDLTACDFHVHTPSERAIDVEVEVLAPAWMALHEVEIWSGHRRVAQAPLPPAAVDPRAVHQRVALRVPVAHAASVVATVRGEASMKPLLGRADITPYAFTSPLWVARR